MRWQDLVGWGLGVATRPAAQSNVEERTQEIGRQLHRRVLQFRPSTLERLQDRVMLLMMEHPVLRTRLLRFIDVQAALPRERWGGRTASLFREYFRGDFQGVPAGVQAALSVARSPVVPAPLIASWARLGARLTAARFVVLDRPRTIGAAITRLRKRGAFPTFDLLGEAVLSEKEATAYRNAYLRVLEGLRAHPLAKQRTVSGVPCLDVSLKLSSLTPHFNEADPLGTLRHVRPALEDICQAARAAGVGVTIDAEQYRYRDLVWYVLRNTIAPREPLGSWADIGLAVQAYLSDADDHAAQVRAYARSRGTPLRVRLVKGAYWDYEAIVAGQSGWRTPVYRDQAETDLSFERICRYLLEDADSIRLAVGSHNIRSHAFAEATREALGLSSGAVEHQTLYRTMEAVSDALARHGFVSREYIPSGDPVPGMAYLVRRILENTSQAGFLTKQRLGEDAEQLLTRPSPGVSDSAYSRGRHGNGFVNTPETAWFERAERNRFELALKDTRRRWGANLTLKLGDRELPAEKVVASLSPNGPDPSRPVAWVHQAGAEQVQEAIRVAGAGADAWSRVPLEERASVGLRTAELLLIRKAEAAAWIVHEGGRTWREAMADVEEAIDHLRWSALELRRLAPVIQDYRPRGVVACIPPWNFPLAIPTGMTAAALMAGNAVILKPAEHTPFIAHFLISLYHEAGVPREAAVLLPGPGRVVGAGLVTSPDVDMIAFTGSAQVGMSIHESATQVRLRRGGLKKVVAEMGGKNAIIVFPDADMDEAVQGVLHSAFSHAGQKCSACSRVYVHEDVFDRFSERLVEAAASLDIGPGTDPAVEVNPLIAEEAHRRVQEYGAIARSEGKVLLDRLGHNGLPWQSGPLIVEVAPERLNETKVLREEIFGPVLPLVRFSNEKELVEEVNGPVYALTLGVFSRSPNTIERMVRECQAGNIYVNRGITGARVGIEPFGGYKLSGTGPKVGGEEYLMAFVTRKPGGGPSGAQDTAWQQWKGGPDAKPLISLLRPWHASAGERLSRLQEAARDFGSSDLRSAVEAVLARHRELSEPQPTVAIPGQRNALDWNAPRGVGVVAVDRSGSAATMAQLVYGALLAGNGVAVCVPPALRPLAQGMVAALVHRGIPRECAALLPAGVQVEDVARCPVHFAAADLTEAPLLSLYATLGVTHRDEGQDWIKAMITTADGPRPGEHGFLRQFALPKLVAIQTLRHGADLELP